MRLIRWAVPALLATAPLSASAQDFSPFRIGIGGSLDVAGFSVAGEIDAPFAFAPGSFADITVPMWFGNLRVEPQIGWTTFDSEFKESFEGETERLRFDASAFRIGTGVAWAWDVAERTKVYVGPRFGLIFRTVETESPAFFFPGGDNVHEVETTTATDFWIGASVGGEAFITPGFSLGLEAQLNYVDFGEPDTDTRLKPAPEPAPEPDPDAPQVKTSESVSVLTTNVMIFARFYFM